MNRKTQRGIVTELLTIVFVLFAAVLIAGPLPVHAQDGQTQQWVEVFVGTENNVFVPAECVSGIEFQTGLTQEEADQTELADFQQALITCDTALFDAPGGNEVIGNSLTAGSSWFVNPVIWNLGEIADQMGQPAEPSTTAGQVQQTQAQPNLVNQRGWIELQLTSGGPLVYVPSTCVQGLPNFGAIVWQGSRDESVTFARENQTPQQQALAQQEIERVTGQPAQQTEQFNWGHSFIVTLACTTAAYNTPGGTAIEAIQLPAGQSWFASPYLWFAPADTAAPLIQPDSAETMDTPQDQLQGETTDQQGVVEPQPTPQY
jgi:hypothetical protein